MTWDIGHDFYLLGEWVSQYWPWLAVFCVGICVAGWLLSEKNVQPEKRPHLSQDGIDRANAYNSHGALPPQFFLDGYKSESVAFLAECLGALSTSETKETGEL